MLETSKDSKEAVRALQTTERIQEVEQRRSSCRGSCIKKPSNRLNVRLEMLCMLEMKNIGKP